MKSFKGKKKRKQVKVILRTVLESFMSSGYAHDERREEKENVRNRKSKSSLLIWVELKGALPTDQEIAKKPKTISLTHLLFHNFEIL